MPKHFATKNWGHTKRKHAQRAGVNANLEGLGPKDTRGQSRDVCVARLKIYLGKQVLNPICIRDDLVILGRIKLNCQGSALVSRSACDGKLAFLGVNVNEKMPVPGENGPSCETCTNAHGDNISILRGTFGQLLNMWV